MNVEDIFTQRTPGMEDVAFIYNERYYRRPEPYHASFWDWIRGWLTYPRDYIEEERQRIIKWCQHYCYLMKEAGMPVYNIVVDMQEKMMIGTAFRYGGKKYTRSFVHNVADDIESLPYRIEQIEWELKVANNH